MDKIVLIEYNDLKGIVIKSDIKNIKRLKILS